MSNKAKMVIAIACLLCIGAMWATVGILIRAKHDAPAPVVVKTVQHVSSAAPAGAPDPGWADNELCMAVYDGNLEKLKRGQFSLFTLLRLRTVCWRRRLRTIPDSVPELHFVC